MVLEEDNTIGTLDGKIKNFLGENEKRTRKVLRTVRLKINFETDHD